MLAEGVVVQPEQAASAEELEARFRGVAAEFGPALRRLARGYEADSGRQEDLVQDILVGVWRALPGFEGRSSLRTWVFRVAHNVAVSHLVKGKRDRLARSEPVDDDRGNAGELLVRNAAREAEGRDAVQRLAALVRALRPADAQIILLYLEGLDYAEIVEVTGLSRDNVGVKIHRIKAALARALDEGGGA